MDIDSTIAKMARTGHSADEIVAVTGLTIEQLKHKSVDLWFLYIQCKEVLQNLARVYGECVDMQS